MTANSCTTNGARLDDFDLKSLVRAAASFHGNAAKRRTGAMLQQMREAGFSPEHGDLCVMNASLRESFAEHHAFRFSPFVEGAVFLRYDLFLMAF